MFWCGLYPNLLYAYRYYMLLDALLLDRWSLELEVHSQVILRHVRSTLAGLSGLMRVTPIAHLAALHTTPEITIAPMGQRSLACSTWLLPKSGLVLRGLRTRNSP